MATPAFNSMNEALDALWQGIGVLKDAADAERARQPPNAVRGQQLDFCEGCLIDLRASLTMMVAPDPKTGKLGVSSGCR